MHMRHSQGQAGRAYSMIAAILVRACVMKYNVVKAEERDDVPRKSEKRVKNGNSERKRYERIAFYETS